MEQAERTGPTETSQLVHGVRLVRISKQGHSLVLNLPRIIRHQMGLIFGDVVGLRVILFQKRVLLIGEKVGVQHVARLEDLPAELLVPLKRNG